jgi:crotonobetaine/carnitine-CoA ligase
MDHYSLPDRKEIFPLIVQRLAGERGDDVFIRDLYGGSFTWRELHEAGLAWAGRLAGLGVEPGAVVATVGTKNVATVARWLGLSWRAAIEVGVNPGAESEAIAKALNDCGARVALVEERFFPKLAEQAGGLEHLATVVIVDGGAPPDELPFSVVAAEDLDHDDAAQDMLIEPQWHHIGLVSQSSGTTGSPKWVLVPWAQLHAKNLGIYPFADLGPADVLYDRGSWFRGGKSAIYLAAMVGGRVFSGETYDVGAFWSDVATEGITVAPLVAPIAQALLRNPEGPGPETPLSKVFISPLIPEHEEFAGRFGVRITTIYDSTEMSVPIRLPGWGPTDWRSSGVPREGYPGYEVRIVDDHDVEVPDGEVGELMVRTQVPWTLNAGYLNLPEATAAAWRNGWFHTGDGMMRRPDGQYVVVDRIKDAIRVNGQMVSSLEIEADVMAHPDVVEVAALAVADGGGDGDDEIHLYVITATGSDLDAPGLSAFLSARMPEERLPRWFEFVDALPRTPATQRVQKALLRTRGIGPNAWDRLQGETVGTGS